ncbi:hypothetical protein CHGG_08747 [Chaetomium globosum CBS 148.51]|uniref:Major facilitator superfamily (MFS) profile domain-containing protein n=1 Tax=Chaetomium globosum (strain ATCC 6205 / CBS 148.51 / DSM 1962 / NBRC 6347 / NRRL 1970) TaxID=306901 RepID=Q2GTF7_CHAGB|nr:uncharacterized protein CHGG_08747 [Chaetomium globosum CBS 148.51]EAQ84733.1 hypothetical protein CHGG_08747 [Chaetomium globosum CBS 148.51]
MYEASNVYFICGFAAIGGGLFGFDISSMSGVLGTQAYKRYFNNPVSYAQGGITASMPAGSLVGSLASSFIADKYSLICGLCVGIASSIVPVYQSEIAPKEIRGRVVSLQQWAITWGILIQYFIQFGAAEGTGGGSKDPNQPTAAFRIPWGVQMVPAFILLVGLFFFPYSPRWLASKDRMDEALRVLARLHGKGDVNHPKVLAQYQEIEEALQLEREQATSSFRDLVAPRMYKRVLLGMSIQMWSQLCGMNIMMYYIVYIMEGAQIASPLATASIHKIRAKAVSLSTATNWFWNMVLAFGVPPLLWNISYKMYYIFGAFNAAAFVHMTLMAPETKGFTLEEMDDVFNSGLPAWKRYKKASRLEELEREIEAGNLKVAVPVGGQTTAASTAPQATESEKKAEPTTTTA